MRRGELYRAEPPSADPRRFRVYLVVSRQGLIDSRYSTILAIPVYTNAANVVTEVPVGPEAGLKSQSWLRCDDLTGVPRASLRHYVGTASPETMELLRRALMLAMGLHDGADRQP